MRFFGASLVIVAIILFVAHGPMGALIVPQRPADLLISEASLFLIWVLPVALTGLGLSLVFERRRPSG